MKRVNGALPWAAIVVVLIAMRTAAADADPELVIGPLFVDPPKLASWLAERDPVVDAARSRYAAAVAAHSQTGVLPNPQLSASIGGFVVGATNPSAPRLGLGQTTNVTAGISELFEIGKRGPRQDAARLRADEAGALATAALGTRVSEAIATLGKLSYVASRRAAVAANLEAARTLQALEQVRRDHADLSGAEFARIELDTQQLELQLGRADADVATAVALCSALMHAACSLDGLAEPAALDHGAPLPDATDDATGAAADAAIERRAAREAARLETAALGADAIVAERRAIPDPTIGVAYTFDNLVIAGNQQQTVMLSLSIPLPIFDRGNHDADAMRANARAAAAEDRAAVSAAHGEITALRAQRATLVSTLARLEADAVPKSATIVQQTRHAFDLGQAGLAELLLAERAHRELLLEMLDTRFDLFNVRAQLRQALGLDDLVARAAQRKP